MAITLPTDPRVPTAILARSKELFEIHKAKGFWDDKKTRNTAETVMLMISEASEGLEAVRTGRRADLLAFEADVLWHEGDPTSDQVVYVEAFKRCIKDTLEDELADTLIRLCDFIGAYDLYPTEIEEEYFSLMLSLDMFPDNIGEGLFWITRELINLPKVLHYRQSLSDQLYKEQAQKLVLNPYKMIYLFALKHNINLDQHVELKLLYNKSRGYKHGKAF
jgi:NTP pyrophosphatase (non-canonical NTP hydrolase)